MSDDEKKEVESWIPPTLLYIVITRKLLLLTPLALFPILPHLQKAKGHWTKRMNWLASRPLRGRMQRM
ncbi:Uncharacterized protein HZ326_8402 [Fusarium oxysporum f. sp. albedinis]|nr:Uncharacterized protein HZ326_8402 [Fusarium oxysporum f. sp. albedinis]